MACAGATSAEAMPAIKKMGFASVVNLRLASEAGADVEGATAAAKAANLNYVHIPFSFQAPETAAADRFLAEIAKPANQPAFIHCGGGGRAATMWFIKRLGRGQVGRRARIRRSDGARHEQRDAANSGRLIMRRGNRNVPRSPFPVSPFELLELFDSPSWTPSNSQESRCFCTFPSAFRGNASTRTNVRGTLKDASARAQASRAASLSKSSDATT